MAQGWLQLAVFVAVVIALTQPLGVYMARVFRNERVFLTPVLGAERAAHLPAAPRQPGEDQDWKVYARNLIAFSLFSWLALYVILRTQGIHPFNPAGFDSGPWDVSFNTASSFTSNTNWQYYGGETTLSYFSQMAGLTVQNFVTAGGRHVRAGGADPRDHRPQRRAGSATSGRTWSGASTTSSCRCRSSSP